MCTTTSPLVVGDTDILLFRVTRFCYKAVEGYNDFQYKLFQVKIAREPLSFSYPTTNIVRCGPTAHGLSCVELFNSLYIPQCNSLAIQFEFLALDGSVEFVGSPTTTGRLQELSLTVLDENNMVYEWEQLKTSNLGFSVSSMLHHYVETNMGFYHVGISLLPACTIFIQYWLSKDTLATWLHEWTTVKLKEAKQQSIMSVTYLSGKIRVQSISSMKMQWLCCPK